MLQPEDRINPVYSNNLRSAHSEKKLFSYTGTYWCSTLVLQVMSGGNQGPPARRHPHSESRWWQQHAVGRLSYKIDLFHQAAT